jgi:NAD-dependent deacetylase
MQIDTARYRNIVVLTGAGVSVASGLPTYRGPGGVWDEHRVEEFGHVRTLREQPRRTWQLFGSLRGPVAQARPNAAHLALARFEAGLHARRNFLLITQNVDGLHRSAGTEGWSSCTATSCARGAPIPTARSSRSRTPPRTPTRCPAARAAPAC